MLARPSLTSSLYRLPEGIKKLVLNAPNKTCDIKDCTNELLPTISNMVNLSLSSGHFPDIWKEGLARETEVTESQHGSDKEKLPARQQSRIPYKDH